MRKLIIVLIMQIILLLSACGEISTIKESNEISGESLQLDDSMELTITEVSDLKKSQDMDDDTLLKMSCAPCFPINDLSEDTINEDIGFSYIKTNINNCIINVYRNTQNSLIVSSTDEQGNCDIISSYTNLDESFWELYEKYLSSSIYDNLFGTQCLEIELPVGANAVLYLIVGEINGDIKLLFQDVDGGLIVDNIDDDQDLELISELGGYFYDIVDGELNEYKIDISQAVSQVVWDEKEHQVNINYADGTQKQGYVDIANLKILISK